MSYTLIAAPLSLYSGKVRGFLRWKNLPFTEVLSTAEVYASDILPRVGWPVIPVLITPEDKTVQDTSDIIDYIEAHEDGLSVYPSGGVQKLAALILELFGDEWLLIAAMHYRWAYNEDFAYAEFAKALFANAPEHKRFDLGKERAEKFKNLLPVLGINEKTAPAIEQTYEEFLRAFDTHLRDHKYAFGSRPSIGDYGLLGPLYAHNYRDPFSGAHMERIAPHVARWAQYTHAPQHVLQGDFLPNDEVPKTLLSIFKMFAREHLPILIDTAKAWKKWAGNNKTTDIPRIIGQHDFVVGGVKSTRGIFPYSLWMTGRVLAHLQSLSGEEKTKALAFLKTIGAAKLAVLDIKPRLIRKNFKLEMQE